MEITEREKLTLNNDDDKSSTLVIATNNFNGVEYDQLDIKIDEFLIVTDWNYSEGWVYGHRRNKKEEKGIFPKVFIKKYEGNNLKNYI